MNIRDIILQSWIGHGKHDKIKRISEQKRKKRTNGGIKDHQDKAFMSEPKVSPESSEIELIKVDGDAEQHDLAKDPEYQQVNRGSTFRC